MKILICPDKFKESLSAANAAQHIFNGIKKVIPGADCRIIPLADGGEGTVDALVAATNGNKVQAIVSDPLLRKVNSFYGISGDGKTAFIEMAAASGMALLKPEERNPIITTSYGTGELIQKTLEKGCTNIILGIGGSATVDGGVGMAQALGIKFTDESGKDVPPGGGYLGAIRQIDTSGLDARIRNCSITVACDVTNILTGPKGAAYVFGPQKGANPVQVKQLDKNLAHLSALVLEQMHIETVDLPGGGAAGGMGAGIVAFLGGEIRKGFDVVSELIGLDHLIQWADLVITGEGKMDSQTAYGKTPAGVAEKALHYGKPVIAFTGALGEGVEKLYRSGFTAIIPIADKPMPLEQSMSRAAHLLEQAAERSFRLIVLIMNK